MPLSQDQAQDVIDCFDLTMPYIHGIQWDGDEGFIVSAEEDSLWVRQHVARYLDKFSYVLKIGPMASES